MPPVVRYIIVNVYLSIYGGFAFARCKFKQDSMGVRRILVVPRDSGGASVGFFWCEMADEVAALMITESVVMKQQNPV